MRDPKKLNPLVDATSPKDWQAYRELICGAWAKSVAQILETARWFAEAEAKLADEDFSKLLASLPFGLKKMSIYKQIGADTRLYEPEVMAQLPPCYSIIYEVHLLNNDELKFALSSRLVHPSVTREKIENLRLKRTYTKLRAQPAAVAESTRSQAQERSQVLPQATESGDTPQRSPTAAQPKYVVLGELAIPRGYKRLSAMHAALMTFVQEYGVEFRPRPGREARIIQEWEERDAAIERFNLQLSKERSARPGE